MFWIGGGKNLRNSWLLQNWQYTFGEFQLPKSKPRRIFPFLESSHHFVDVIFKLNLHNLIFVNKNKPLDLHIGCYKHWWVFDLVNACKVKYGLIDELEVDFNDGVEHEEIFDIHLFIAQQK